MSICSVSERKPTPRPFRSVMMSSRFGKRAAEAIELPDHEHVAGAEVGEAGLQAGTVVLRAGRAIMMEMTLVDPGRGERVALQVDGLAIVGGGNTHVPDQHARQTLISRYFRTGLAFRQGLSCRKSPMRAGVGESSASLCPENKCFPEGRAAYVTVVDEVNPVADPQETLKRSASRRWVEH